MLFSKSVKQLLRTPVTAVLFLVLFSIAAFFVVGGVNIWARNEATIKAYEDVFVTIGTVRQKATATNLEKEWDAGLGQYITYSSAEFSPILSPSVLEFDGANYLIHPEKRAYYISHAHGLQLKTNDPLDSGTVILVEVTPLEDCIPSKPVQMRVLRAFGDYQPLEKDAILFLCDHNNDAPQPLDAGKAYIMSLSGPNLSHGDGESLTPEYQPGLTISSTQYHVDGTLVEDELIDTFYQEVTEGFYETANGKRWLELVTVPKRVTELLPVLPTSATHLLLPFYNKTAYWIGYNKLYRKEEVMI